MMILFSLISFLSPFLTTLLIAFPIPIIIFLYDQIKSNLPSLINSHNSNFQDNINNHQLQED